MSVAGQRYQAILAVIGEGRTVIEVASQWGVTRRTVHRWLARYELEGLEGLNDRSHRPERCPHQMGAEAEVIVLELRRAHRYWGARRLALELARKQVTPAPSESGVYPAWGAPASSTRPSATVARRCGSAGSEVARWSCGRWTWSAASCSPTGPQPKH